MQFIRVGRFYVAASEVRSVEVDHAGQVVVHFAGRSEVVPGDEGRAVVEWAEANRVGAPAPKGANPRRVEKV